MEPTIAVTFTHNEARLLIQMIHIAVQARGLELAAPAVLLANKLGKPLEAATATAAVPTKEPSQNKVRKAVNGGGGGGEAAVSHG